MSDSSLSVVCVKNQLSSIKEPAVRERLSRSIHLEGPISDLTIGKSYFVQAIETRDGGIWVYLILDREDDYPYPFPAEFFNVQEDCLPADWRLRLALQDGNSVLKRISFPEWASDDRFYERLVDGDRESVFVYRRRQVQP